MNNSELTALIIKLIFAVVSVYITYYLVPFLKSLSDQNKDKKLRKFIKEAVLAAEQVIKDPGNGVKKKDMVMTEAEKWLKDHNINISESELDNIVEAIVFAMNNAKEELLND